jgi:transcriptional regulator with XRE-family HTH domain
MMRVRQQMGREIQRIRQRNRLTQEQAAGLAGVDPKYLSKVEGGRENISVDTLARLANALGVPVGAFFQCRKGGGGDFTDRFGRRALVLIRSARYSRKKLMLGLLEHVARWKD